MAARRPPHLRRSWLFVGGGDDDALTAAAASGADVVILELEDFTAPAERLAAREKAAGLFETWRAAGIVAAARVNPLATNDGPADLAAVMAARPDAVLLPKVAEPRHVVELDTEVARLEAEAGMPVGATELVPNVELARGLIQTYAICTASARVAAALVASEDMAADLGAERGPDGLELDYVRRRFIVECTAAGVPAIDCPYTWSDAEGQRADSLFARRLGYKAKSLVDPAHAAVVNDALTPSADDVANAERIVAAFEAAQAAGAGRIEVDGSQVEVPIYMNAKRLLARAEDLAAFA
ncbi:MAG: CoA ester lyase [Rhodospirillaceae bacterium]